MEIKFSDFSKFHLKTSKCWTLVCCVRIELSEEAIINILQMQAWTSKIASKIYICGKAKVVTLVYINSETKSHQFISIALNITLSFQNLRILNSLPDPDSGCRYLFNNITGADNRHEMFCKEDCLSRSGCLILLFPLLTNYC